MLALVACHKKPELSEADFAVYDKFRRPDRVLAALPAVDGATIADVGAGGGYLTLRLARAVGPSGHVVATDIDKQALTDLAERAQHAALSNIETRQTTADDPGLEPGRYRAIVLSHVDHLLADRIAFLKKLAPALEPKSGVMIVVNSEQYRQAVHEALALAGYSWSDQPLEPPAQFVTLARIPRW